MVTLIHGAVPQRRLRHLAYQPEALTAFSIMFGIVDFATVTPSQMLASKDFGGLPVGVVFGLLSLVHQIGSALGSHVPGVVYTSTGSCDVILIVGHRTGSRRTAAYPAAGGCTQPSEAGG